MANDPCFSSATLLARRLRKGDLAAVDLIEAYLERIDAHNATTNAYVQVLTADARDAAQAADAAVKAGDEGGPLHGVPAAISGRPVGT